MRAGFQPGTPFVSGLARHRLATVHLRGSSGKRQSHIDAGVNYSFMPRAVDKTPRHLGSRGESIRFCRCDDGNRPSNWGEGHLFCSRPRQKIRLAAV